MKFLAVLADRILNWLAPPNRRITDVLAPDPLTVAEQYRDAWEKNELDNLDCPQCFPEGWEELIHDPVCVDDVDDLEPAPRPASARRGGAEPAGTGPLSPVPAGAPHPSLIISRIMRDLGVAVPAVAAEAAAKEITNFYNLTPKK